MLGWKSIVIVFPTPLISMISTVLIFIKSFSYSTSDLVNCVMVVWKRLYTTRSFFVTCKNNRARTATSVVVPLTVNILSPGSLARF